MLLIGSRALEKFMPIGRTPKDYDYIATKEEALQFIADNYTTVRRIKESDDIISCIINTTLYEFHLAKPGSAFEEYLKLNEGRDHANMDTLYSIKLGHIHFPVGQNKFTKHIGDLVLLGALRQRNDLLEHLTKKHFKDTEERIGKLKTPSLMKSSNKFFQQSDGLVKSWFVHDDIHEVMAHKEKPMYTYMQPDPTLASCSKAMWLEFTTIEKIQCVLEEAYVIALERKIIPMIFGGTKLYDSETAFDWALWRICTNLCSGWFRRFAVDYYAEVLAYHDVDYASKFFGAIDEGKIKFI